MSDVHEIDAGGRPIAVRKDLRVPMRDGITLDDGPVRPRGLKVVSTVGGKSLVRLTLHEGRNHIVRRTMEHVGHPVRQLSRIGIVPVRLGTLKVGQIRDLTSEELGALLDLVDGS